MHCPTCGQPATNDQQFCRVCGMNLHAISKLVEEHAGLTPETQKKMSRAERERQIVGAMFNWMKWGLILIGFGVLMVVTNKTYNIGGLFRILAALVTIIGTGVCVAGLLNAVRNGTATTPNRPALQSPPTTEPTSLPTNPIPQALSSVTERTTQLIGVAPSKAPIDRRVDE